MLSCKEFQGRTAVVTGGSDGLGFDMCRALCAAGSRVYFCGRDTANGEKAEKALGPRSHYARADISLPGDIHDFAEFVHQTEGRIDYLINNVATDDRIRFEDLTEENCDRFWQVNLRSHILLTRACLASLRAGEGKAVLNVGTTNYMLGLEPFALYNATKSGLLGFTRSLARELGREDIRVNMISPGWVMTAKQLREHVTQTDKDELLRDQALKFLLTPEHVSSAALFLLSGAASAITGQNLVVDGGKYMA